ncbi:MAG: glutathione S-transferase C-terminal domain-containing protein [Burkholderiales bacterium]
MGHVTLACALGWLDFRFPDAGWRATRPQLDAWFARVSLRASLAETTPRA